MNIQSDNKCVFHKMQILASYNSPENSSIRLMEMYSDEFISYLFSMKEFDKIQLVENMPYQYHVARTLLHPFYISLFHFTS